MTIKTAILSGLMLVSGYVAYSQDQHVIDSIVPLIRHDGSQNDMEIFYELGFQYVTNDLARSIAYLDSTAEIAYKIGDSLKVVKASRLKAQVLRRAGQQVEALQILERMLPIATRLRFEGEVAMILRSLATTHSHLANFDKGLIYSFKALDISQKQGDLQEVASVLLNTGFVHYKVKNLDRAIDYFNQSLELSESNGFLRTSQLSYSNLGMAYVIKGDFAEAKRWLNKSMDVCYPNCSSDLLVFSGFGLGLMAFKMNQIDTAKLHFTRSYTISCEINELQFQAENLVMLAKISLLENDYSTSEKLLMKAAQISNDGKYRSVLSSVYHGFFELYKKLGDTGKASIFLEKNVELNDSILSTEVSNKMALAQIEYEERENRMTILHNEQLLAKQKSQNKLVVIICVLLCLIAIGLFVGLRNKQRANSKLDERVKERTRALESHKDALEKAYFEQNELISKTSQSIKSALATQKGLTESIAKIEHSTEIDLKTTAQAIESELNGLADELSAKNFSARSNPESE